MNDWQMFCVAGLCWLGLSLALFPTFFKVKKTMDDQNKERNGHKNER